MLYIRALLFGFSVVLSGSLFVWCTIWIGSCPSVFEGGALVVGFSVKIVCCYALVLFASEDPG